MIHHQIRKYKFKRKHNRCYCNSKNGAGEEKEYIVRIQKRQPAITGKVITQASDQANQTATIKVYKTSDTRNENDADNPRELIKEIEIKLDGSYTLDLKPDEYDIVVTKHHT